MGISRKPENGEKLNGTKAPAFKQEARYEWPKEEKFVITGEELDVILKSLQAAANTPEFSRYASIYQGLSIVNNVFKDGVEQGLIREVDDKKPVMQPVKQEAVTEVIEPE